MEIYDLDQTENGERRMENSDLDETWCRLLSKLRMENREWRIVVQTLEQAENGEWRMEIKTLQLAENGEWRMEIGDWRLELDDSDQ